ncbi:MAG: hypothetical protein DWB48_00115 [Nitrosomonas sp.]|nr:hypothetical protein [Nitrosomonas sp.]
MKNTNSKNEKTNLQKLLEKQAKLKEQIKLEQKKADEKAKEAHIQKCVLVGALILDHINSNGELSGQILTILNSGVESESDRKLLDLKPQPNKGGNAT